MEAAAAELHSLVQRCRQELLCQGYCVVPSMLTSDDLDQLRLVSIFSSAAAAAAAGVRSKCRPG